MKKFCKAVLLLSAVTLMGTAASVQADAKTKVKVSKVTVKSNYGSRVRVAVGKKIKLKNYRKGKAKQGCQQKSDLQVIQQKNRYGVSRRLCEGCESRNL